MIIDSSITRVSIGNTEIYKIMSGGVLFGKEKDLLVLIGI